MENTRIHIVVLTSEGLSIGSRTSAKVKMRGLRVLGLKKRLPEGSIGGEPTRAFGEKYRTLVWERPVLSPLKSKNKSSDLSANPLKGGEGCFVKDFT